MKAVVVKSPGDIRVMDVPDPIISDYDVLCDTMAVAVCGGTDNHIVNGHPYFVRSYPLILGHEGIGRVVKCGRKVRNYKEGDVITRVFNKLPENSGYYLRDGAFAEKTVATDWMAMKEDGVENREWERFRVQRVLSAGADPVASTMIITWRETLSFLNRVGVNKNDKVLIIGSGANALSFAEHLKNLSARVFAIGSDDRKDVFLDIGGDKFYSYKDIDYVKDQAFNDFNLVIDTIGKSDSVNIILPYLANNAKVAMYGLDDIGNYLIQPTLAKGDLSFYNGEIYDEASAHDEVMEYLKEGKLNYKLYIQNKHIYKLNDIARALEVTRKRLAFKSVIKFY